jgi:hypothetical protein
VVWPLLEAVSFTVRRSRLSGSPSAGSNEQSLLTASFFSLGDQVTTVSTVSPVRVVVIRGMFSSVGNDGRLSTSITSRSGIAPSSLIAWSSASKYLVGSN